MFGGGGRGDFFPKKTHKGGQSDPSLKLQALLLNHYSPVLLMKTFRFSGGIDKQHRAVMG